MDKLITIFKVPELRRKILFTALLLAIYRIGFYVPLPIVNQSQLKNWEEQQTGNTAGKLFGTVAMFGGTSIGMSTIFGLGIMPYISASIIFQLLASVVPSLEAMMKEGESGRKRINEYTRYATVVLCAIQSAFWVQYMMSPQMNVVLQRYHTVLEWVRLRLHHDGRHDLPHVDRRADRRVRHRQRHQPVDHGRHPGAAAGCDHRPERPVVQLDLEAQRRARQVRHHHDLAVDRALHSGGRRRDRDHREPAANSHPVGQARARPPGLRRHQAIPAAESQPGGRDADHLRLEPLDLPFVRLQQPGTGHHAIFSPIAGRSARSSPGYSAIWPMPSSGKATSTRFAT